MLTLIFLSPLVVVALGAFVVRYGVLCRRYRSFGWCMIVFLLVGSLFLPLKWGVWIPEILGYTRTLASTETSTGEVVRVTQRWNYVDFYTTELTVTQTNGQQTSEELDGDDDKSWSVPLTVDENTRVATVILSGNRTATTTW